MEKYYTVFITTRELAQSPPVTKYGNLHDITMFVGEKKSITLLLPSFLHWHYDKSIEVEYEHNLFDVSSITTKSKPSGLSQSLVVQVEVIAKEIGSTTLGVHTPSLVKNPSRYTSPPQWIRNNPISSS